MLNRFFRFLKGYVIFSVSGKFAERFLNVCSKNGIAVWGTKRRGESLHCVCAAVNYKKFHALRRSCGVRLRITERRGVPFIRHRYRFRLGLVVGAIFFFLIINMLSASIWNIRIQGNERVDEAKITAALEKIGITYGVRRESIDCNQKRQQLMMEIPELSWAAINITGSTAVVDVKEILVTPERDDKTPCNLRAKRDGVIVSYTVSEGQIMFLAGDAVRTGDLLVSGTIPLSNGQTELRNAKGAVVALTDHRLEFKATFEQRAIARTGEYESRKVFSFFGVNIPLYLGSVRYPYQKETKRYHLEADHVKLPIWLTDANFYKTAEQVWFIDEPAAEELAKKQIEELEQTELNGMSIVERNLKIYTDEQGVKIIAEYICEEDIAVSEKILINSSIS